MNGSNNTGSVNRRITIGVLAHVDAGKTTLTEAILYMTGEIRKLGRVDHRSTYLDDNEIERNRGITIFSKQASFSITGRTIGGDQADMPEVRVTMIDTPGHTDFAAEMERSLAVIDYALLVVSGSEGVQSHTKTLAGLLRDRGIPMFIFVNKMDIAVRQPEDILDDLSEELGIGAVDFTHPGSREHLIDDITLHSSVLADKVLEHELAEDAAEVSNGDAPAGAGGYEDIITDDDIAGAVKRGEIVPCIFGSALRLTGIGSLLEALARYTSEPLYGQDFAARVYKVTAAENGERLCFIKVTGGDLHVRDRIGDEKVNQIRLYSGSRFTTAETVKAGDVCAVTGLSACPGEGLGAEPPDRGGSIAPYMRYTVTGPEGMDPYLVMKDMSLLAEEDPALDVRWIEEPGEIEIRLMGQVQLEVLSAMISSRFGYEVEFGSGRIIYLETIGGTYEGVGHFEPLRHYAEVHLIVEPGETGSGIVINSSVPEDELARNWQRLISTHLEEKQHRGVLIGAPLTDVKITLAAGRAHDKHTSGGDFREAVYRAVRNALMQARADGRAVLLEPWLEYEIELPSQNVGRAMTDVDKMGGTQSSLEQDGDVSRIRGRIPATGIAGYQQILTGYTSGSGRLSLTPAGYAPCHDAGEVIESYGYDPEHDVDNTADSVFVSHGGSDIVKWDKVSEHMHLPWVLRRSGDSAKAGYDSIGRTGGHISGRADKDETARREAELRDIFERTYGPVRQQIRRDAKTKTVRPGEGRDDARNLEIKARHERRSSGSADSGRQQLPAVMIIDGYNLIFADEYLTELAARDIGSARDQIMDRLCNYAAYYGIEMSVVFDAYKVPAGAGSEEDYHGVRVIFTRQDEPADIRIGLMTGEMVGRTLYIVTSDSLVQQDAWGHGALRISSREFLKLLADTEDEIRNRL